MIRNIFLTLIFVCSTNIAFANANTTPSNQEIIKSAERLAKASKDAKESWEANKDSLKEKSYYNFQNIPKPEKTTIIPIQQYGKEWQDYSNSFKYLEPEYKVKVFLSFSVPKKSWMKYIHDAQRLGRSNVTLVIRGLDKSKNMAITSKHILALTKGYNVEVDINPVDFDKFEITAVPALIVYKKNKATLQTCTKKGFDRKGVNESFVGVYGDVGMDYALLQLEDSALNKEMKKAISAFEKILHPGL